MPHSYGCGVMYFVDAWAEHPFLTAFPWRSNCPDPTDSDERLGIEAQYRSFSFWLGAEGDTSC